MHYAFIYNLCYTYTYIKNRQNNMNIIILIAQSVHPNWQHMKFVEMYISNRDSNLHCL